MINIEIQAYYTNQLFKYNYEECVQYYQYTLISSPNCLIKRLQKQIVVVLRTAFL